MYTRPVLCSTPGCSKDAEYKIAAPWSAGRFNELKKYGLACESHYAQCYRDALRRRKNHVLSAEETQGEICVYKYQKGKLDRDLEKVANPT